MALRVTAGLLFVAAGLAAPAVAGPPAPLLECTFTYGGEATVLDAGPTADPYRVAAVPIGRRFAARVVWSAGPDDQAAIAVYVYHPTADGPLLLAETKYRPPWPVAGAGSRNGFTGLHTVYEPDVAGELQWWCGFRP
jgi:hypothetical protein